MIKYNKRRALEKMKEEEENRAIINELKTLNYQLVSGLSGEILTINEKIDKLEDIEDRLVLRLDTLEKMVIPTDAPPQYVYYPPDTKKHRLLRYKGCLLGTG